MCSLVFDTIINEISLETFRQLLAAQNNVCAICQLPETHLDMAGKTRELCVDHCHNSGNIRQLLCNRCNTLLGKVKDDIDLLKKAVAYLERHQVF